MVRAAILDDYQNVALKLADWSPIAKDVEIKVFDKPFASPDEVIKALQGFAIVVGMRERTPFPRKTIEASAGLEKAGRKISSMSWLVSFPPPPCASNTQSSAGLGTGQASSNSFIAGVSRTSSKRRRRLRLRPWALREASRACSGWRKPGTRAAS